MKVSTIGLDLAKNVFQVHGLDEAGEVIVRRALRRRQVVPFFERLGPCLIGMEACGTSHYWGLFRMLLQPGMNYVPPSAGSPKSAEHVRCQDPEPRQHYAVGSQPKTASRLGSANKQACEETNGKKQPAERIPVLHAVPPPPQARSFDSHGVAGDVGSG